MVEADWEGVADMESLEKFLGSRKFIIWVGTTILYASGGIDVETWKWITVGYLGAQGGVDVAEKFRGKSWTANYKKKQ